MAHSEVTLDDYRRIVGDETIDRIKAKGKALRGMRVVHMNSTYYAGGVVEIILSLMRMKNELGLNAEWRLLRGSDAFFEFTREMHDAMQGGPLELTPEKAKLYDDTMRENTLWNTFDHDAVYMHDHHTMGIIAHAEKTCPWIWRGHLDMSETNPELLKFLKPYADRYDAAIVILESYFKDAFDVPQYSFKPAIDPLKPHNQPFPEGYVQAKLAEYNIPDDRPIITQIGRFDHFKDPVGVVDAFEIASKKIDATLVILGNRPSDDPEDNPVWNELVKRRSDRVIVLDTTDYDLVGALQQHAVACVQKSTREGFGLTVSEAMWKGTPVIGGNAGGIPAQIDEGESGYIVNSVEETAERMVEIVSKPELADGMGDAGRDRVRRDFLITRLLEQHLDLLGSFETRFVPTL